MLILLVQEPYSENPMLPWLQSCTLSAEYMLISSAQVLMGVGQKRFFKCKLWLLYSSHMGYVQATAVTLAGQTINTGTFRLPSVGAIEYKLPAFFNSPTIA